MEVQTLAFSLVCNDPRARKLIGHYKGPCPVGQLINAGGDDIGPVGA